MVFVAAMIFAFVGSLIYKWMVFDPSGGKGRKGQKFDLGFWLKDNWSELVMGFVLNWMLVVFAKQIVGWAYPEALDFFKDEMNMLIYLVIGGLQAPIVELVKKKLRKIRGK